MKTLRELLLDLNKEGFGSIENFDNMDVESQFSTIKRQYHRRCLQTHPDKGGNIEGNSLCSIPSWQFPTPFSFFFTSHFFSLRDFLFHQSSALYRLPLN